MQTIYRLETASELDEAFIQSLKLLFKDRPIEITVTDINDEVPSVWEAVDSFRAIAMANNYWRKE